MALTVLRRLERGQARESKLCKTGTPYRAARRSLHVDLVGSKPQIVDLVTHRHWVVGCQDPDKNVLAKSQLHIARTTGTTLTSFEAYVSGGVTM